MQVTSSSSVSSVESSQVRSSRRPEGPPPPGEHSHVSKGGRSMSQLAKLSESNSEKFKQVASEVSKQLAEAAESASGDEAEALKKMSADFASAAETGKMPEPPKHAEGGGGMKRGYPPPEQAEGVKSKLDALLSSALSKAGVS